MKKQVLFIAFAGALSTLNAQSFPNGGFENWTNQGTYEDPQYWTGMNMLTLFGAEETAIKSTQAHSGTYALKLVTSISLERPDALSCAITDDGALKRLKFHDLLTGQNDELGWDDLTARLDADLLLMASTLNTALLSISQQLADHA